MIAHEHIQMISMKEIVISAVIALIASFFILLGNTIFAPSFSFLATLIFLVIGMNFAVYLIKKTGIATLFYVLTAIMTFHLDDIGVFGMKKILVFFLAGLLFEAGFLFFKLHIHSLPLDMLIGTSLSTTSIPLLTAFSLSPGLASSFPVGLFNLMLLALAVGLVASVLAAIIWYDVERAKPILKLESYLMSLRR